MALVNRKDYDNSRSCADSRSDNLKEPEQQLQTKQASNSLALTAAPPFSTAPREQCCCVTGLNDAVAQSD